MNRKITPELSGYTWVEMLIVVSILGVLSATIIPSFSHHWRDERLNTAAKIITAWIEDQRKRAIQNSSPCDITFDSQESNFTVLCTHETSGLSPLTIQDLVDNGADVNIVSNSGITTSWAFTPRGTTTDLVELRLTLKGHDDLGRCIQVTKPLGLVRSTRLNSQGRCDYTTAF